MTDDETIQKALERLTEGMFICEVQSLKIYDCTNEISDQLAALIRTTSYFCNGILANYKEDEFDEGRHAAQSSLDALLVLCKAINGDGE
jgi:hypothetical protein